MKRPSALRAVVTGFLGMWIVTVGMLMLPEVITQLEGVAGAGLDNPRWGPLAFIVTTLVAAGGLVFLEVRNHLAAVSEWRRQKETEGLSEGKSAETLRD